MKRTVEFFIHQGEITKEAKEEHGKYIPGTIKVFNSVNPKDPNGITVYTHYCHSFVRDANNKPKHNQEKAIVYFFLVPMEYLFSGPDLLGTDEETPFLAVNVNDIYPFMYNLKDGSVTKHPCNFATTICGDSFETNPPITMSLFLMNPFYLDHFIRRLFHKRKRFLYGINDYGELTIIDCSQEEIDKNDIRPWSKILLKPKLFPKHEHFSRVYSPKIERRVNVEFKILVQKFGSIDPDWEWVIDKPFGPQPVPKVKPNVPRDNPSYPWIVRQNKINYTK